MQKRNFCTPDSEIQEALKQAFAYHQAGQLAEAEAIYRQVLAVAPRHPDALHLYGVARQQGGAHQEAAELMEKAIALVSDSPVYHGNLGAAYQCLNQMEKARAAYQKAIELKPDYAEAYSNLGLVFKAQGHLDQALSQFEQALAIKPDYAEAHANMGNVRQAKGDMAGAIASFKKALELNPRYTEAYYNLGNSYSDHLRAIDAFEKALALSPRHPKAVCNLFHRYQYICDWEKVAALSPRVDELMARFLEKGEKTPLQPLISLMKYADPAKNYAIAKTWSQDLQARMAGHDLKFSFDRRGPKDKIRIGYLSNDFRNHPVSHLIAGLFEQHSRQEFEIFGYSYGRNDGSQYRQRIEAGCDCFVDLIEMSFADGARRIHSDGVDILVDLMGYTKGEKLGICALNPAPVQMTYLGFAGTTGSRFFHYLITDRIVTPPAVAPWYSEQFLYMPHTYMVTDDQQAISDKQWQRADFGLPESGPVFCSFNQPYKIEPVLFDIWMRLLRELPQSVLWLSFNNPRATENLRAQAQKRGVDGRRLIFAQRLASKADYLARLRLADLGLDTRIYNGHATTADALWAGVPVLTLQGSHFASRVAASLVTAAGLPELVAQSTEEYFAIALELGKKPAALAQVREKLRQNRERAPLFDTQGFARHLEAGYKRAWALYQAGEAPRRIDVYSK